MEINRLCSELEYANHSGSTLSIEELTHLQLSVHALNENENFDCINFWGRIKGVENDFYIVVGMRFKERINFPERHYFWCYNDFFLSPLKDVSPENCQWLATLNCYFSGQHDKILRNQSFDTPAQEVVIGKDGKASVKMDADSIKERGNQIKPITELDRLGYLVRLIDHECAVIPHAAYRCTPNDEIRKNMNFKGLNLTEIGKLSNYCHFRPNTQETRIDLLARNDRTQILNFFDGLKNDVVDGAWSLHTDDTSYIKHAKWPGFLFYHRANSDIHGYAYFGDGRKLRDIHFLI